MAAVLEELGPPGILGTPSLSPAQGPTPPQEGKGSYRRLSSQARGPGQEDSLLPPPLQVGPGLRDFPICGRTSLAVSSSPPPPLRFQLHHKALPLREGGGHLGTAERCCPSRSLHSAILHTHTHRPCTLRRFHDLAYLGMQLLPSTELTLSPLLTFARQGHGPP